MARGKQTCKILKEIRRQIADANGIEFVTSECRYKGDCLGTCPKCEAEVRYLEQQLRSRQRMGKAVALAGISAGMIALSGCGNSENRKPSDSNYILQGEPPMEMVDTFEWTEGEVEKEDEAPAIEDTVSTSVLSGVKEGEVPNSQDIAPLPTVGEVPDENRIYTAVEQYPEFPGGQTALLKFIGDNLKYPKEMVGCFQGSIRVRFYVDTLGHVCDPQIIRGMDSALDREVLRVVRLFPDFIPGQHEGRKVNVYVNLPISFDPNRY